MLTANGNKEEGGSVKDMVLCRVVKGEENIKAEDKLQTFYPDQGWLGGVL